MFQQLRISAILLLLMTILTGVLYPLTVTAVAWLLFPHQAGGSLLLDGDRVVGSELIGQQFTRPEYFWGRLSATAPVPYNAAASGGSNLGPSNPSLLENARSRRTALGLSNADQVVPIDLLTSSASGLDPHISLAAAQIQIPRVAKARGLTEDQLIALVMRHQQSQDLGILGQPRVNVLKLNLALDAR